MMFTDDRIRNWEEHTGNGIALSKMAEEAILLTVQGVLIWANVFVFFVETVWVIIVLRVDKQKVTSS